MREQEIDDVLAWCESILGPVALLSDQSREHAGLRAGTYHLRGCDGLYYLKVHRDRSHWEHEVHAYERWAPVLHGFAPRLEAVRTDEPLALIITELPGTVMEDAILSLPHRVQAWHDAGQALAQLHTCVAGSFFGGCRRDGSPLDAPVTDAVSHLQGAFDDWLTRGQRLGCLEEREFTFISDVIEMLPVFAGEIPAPCHYDYCPPNWLVDEQGCWRGVIDFEFSRWDVRAADFSRFPDWDWIEHPELLDAMIAGYGCRRDHRFEQQLYVSLVLYALAAIVWGMEVGYRGFAAEGRHALSVLAARDGHYGP
ncbi:MAG: aminoglycoside phosphotransferase family protein [Anaerolineae bacterium]|nr:aminoglycoside phosphotransferase family protein [Anaerolineae bacterium]